MAKIGSVAASEKEVAKLSVNGVQIAYKDLKIEHIIDWCKTHGQVEWLKTIAQTKVEVKKYPRVQVVKLGVDGKPELTKKGKVKMISKADKTATPEIEKKLITFVQIKKAFAEKFAPEIIPVAKEKDANMYDIIASL